MKLTKKILTVFLSLVMVLGLGLSVNVSAEDDSDYNEVTLETGVTVLTSGDSDKNYIISEGSVLVISGSTTTGETITFKNCKFTITGESTYFKNDYVGYTGESKSRLAVGNNVTFENCVFEAKDVTATSYSSGNNSTIGLFAGTINFNNSTITGDECTGQFITTYSTANVTFDNSSINVTNNKKTWVFGMYNDSVWNMVDSSMICTGITGTSSTFYSGDTRTVYHALYITNSYIEFSDGNNGGFAINNINSYVTNSTIKVNNTHGYGIKDGVWTIKESTIQVDGNGTHGMSIKGITLEDSSLEILHNGYAGLYIQSYDSSFKNSTVDIRCNGEKYLTYSAGDIWLNGHTLSVDDCTSNALEGSAWLGAVGRKGSVTTTDGSSIVAYDLSSNSADNLKSNCTAVLTSATVALSSEEDEHTLFLNPWMITSYARGNGENKKVHTSQSSNDVDLFEDDNVATDDANYIINAKTAKIGILTTAQLSHHIYDWDNEIFVSAANEDDYGVVKYECIDVCEDYTSNTDEHTYSFDCEGTYVYAPLVGLTFDANTEDEVTNMPDTQDEIDYYSTAIEPTSDPEREGYRFEGWYVDEECTEEYDFDTQLTSNWTVVYAKWVECTEVTVTKEWSGETDDSVRPDSITVELYADGEATGNTIEIIEDEDGNWIGEFTKLDITNSDGEAIVYTVVESSEDSYEATYSDVLVDDNGYYSVTITNTYVEILSENTEDPEEPETQEEVEAEADLEQEPVEETGETSEAETESDTSDQSVLIGYGVVGIIALLGVYLTIKIKKEN